MLRECLVFFSPPILSRCCALSRMLGVSCRILDRSGWCVTLQHSLQFVVSFNVFCLHLHAGRGICVLLLEYCGPGLADGCVALVQLVPMGCPVKADGSVVTWGSCTSRWVLVRGEVGQVLLSPCGVPCVELCQTFALFSNAVLLLWWSGDFQAPSAAREQGFHLVGVWLQWLSWVNIVRVV